MVGHVYVELLGKRIVPQNLAGFTPTHRRYTLEQFRMLSIHFSVSIFPDMDILLHFYL